LALAPSSEAEDVIVSLYVVSVTFSTDHFSASSRVRATTKDSIVVRTRYTRNESDMVVLMLTRICGTYVDLVLTLDVSNETHVLVGSFHLVLHTHERRIDPLVGSVYLSHIGTPQGPTVRQIGCLPRFQIFGFD
jgi:hypothetical protein